MKAVLVGAGVLCVVLAGLAQVTSGPDDDDGPFTLNPTKTGVGSVNCTLADGRPGLCVNYNLCYANLSIIKYGEPDSFEIRRGVCPSHREWCCANDIIVPEETDSTQSVPQRLAVTAGGGSTDPTVAPGASTSEAAITAGTLVPATLRCGVMADGLRQGGSQFVYGECPWCVALFRRGGNPKWMNSNGYFCTGSLIHPSVVLTAANCAKSVPAGNMWARVGDYDLSRGSELFPHQELQVRAALVHDQYNSGTKAFNIALLVLATPARLEDNVNTVCLAGEAAASCVAVGWGRDEAGVYSDLPVKVPTTPVESAACEAAYRAAGSPHFTPEPGAACVSSPRDSCPAHHGSPLYCTHKSDKSRFTQQGVISWSLRCGAAGAATPLVFTRLAPLLPWINAQMASNSLDTDSYTF